MDEEKQPPTLTGERHRRASEATTGWSRPSVDERLDEALKQTFPASDAFEISAK